jgi:hypothetical protein
MKVVDVLRLPGKSASDGQAVKTRVLITVAKALGEIQGRLYNTIVK